MGALTNGPAAFYWLPQKHLSCSRNPHQQKLGRSYGRKSRGDNGEGWVDLREGSRGARVRCNNSQHGSLVLNFTESERCTSKIKAGKNQRIVARWWTLSEFESHLSLWNMYIVHERCERGQHLINWSTSAAEDTVGKVRPLVTRVGGVMARLGGQGAIIRMQPPSVCTTQNSTNNQKTNIPEVWPTRSSFDIFCTFTFTNTLPLALTIFRLNLDLLAGEVWRTMELENLMIHHRSLPFLERTSCLYRQGLGLNYDLTIMQL